MTVTLTGAYMEVGSASVENSIPSLFWYLKQHPGEHEKTIDAALKGVKYDQSMLDHDPSYGVYVRAIIKLLLDRELYIQAYLVRSKFKLPKATDILEGLVESFQAADDAYLDLQMGNFVYRPDYPLEERFRGSSRVPAEGSFKEFAKGDSKGTVVHLKTYNVLPGFYKTTNTIYFQPGSLSNPEELKNPKFIFIPDAGVPQQGSQINIIVCLTKLSNVVYLVLPQVLGHAALGAAFYYNYYHPSGLRLVNNP